MSEPITWPQDFIDRLIERTAKVQDRQPQAKLRPDQAEALIHLLARATRSGCLPSMSDTLRLLDSIPDYYPTQAKHVERARQKRSLSMREEMARKHFEPNAGINARKDYQLARSARRSVAASEGRASWQGMTLKAFVIQSIAQAVERDWERLIGTLGMTEEREQPSAPHLVPRRLGDGWKCSNDGCSWESKRPPGPMADSVHRRFDKDAEESFPQHLADCPTQRERTSA